MPLRILPLAWKMFWPGTISQIPERRILPVTAHGYFVGLLKKLLV
jgi:hypothetical protein